MQPGSYALRYSSRMHAFKFGRILDVLQSLGMNISLEKTVILMSIRGSGFAQLGEGWVGYTTPSTEGIWSFPQPEVTSYYPFGRSTTT